MRKVNGEKITIKELKNSTFGYDDYKDLTQIVELIEVDGTIFAVNEVGDMIIGYPKNPYDDERFVDACEKDTSLSVWNFFTGYWGLEKYDLTAFTFYFME